MAQYQFDNAWRQARQRLALLEAQLDPSTIEYLERLGVGDGWRCLEVGGGGGSIAAWLAERVGPSGYVLATDIDTRFLEALDSPSLEVRRHDIVAEALPAGEFDLVHARAVLTHLPERATALGRMVAALKPGGWLLAEEPDATSIGADPGGDPAAAALYAKQSAAIAQLGRARGLDPTYGRRLYGDLIRQGLADVKADGRVRLARGGSPSATFFRLTLEQIREHLIGAGLLSDHEVVAVLALLDDPNFIFMEPIGVAAWGRRPVA